MGKVIEKQNKKPEWPVSIIILLLFFLKKFFVSFWPCCEACGILVHWPGIEPQPSTQATGSESAES